MDASEHRRQVERQITRAWQTYVDACLSHQPDSAKIAEAQFNRLLELDVFPRPRTADHDALDNAATT